MKLRTFLIAIPSFFSALLLRARGRQPSRFEPPFGRRERWIEFHGADGLTHFVFWPDHPQGLCCGNMIGVSEDVAKMAARFGFYTVGRAAAEGSADETGESKGGAGSASVLLSDRDGGRPDAR